MAMNFPDTPAVGDIFPSAPTPGIPTYRWDGEKWSMSVGTGTVAARPIMDDGSVPMQQPLILVNPLNPQDAAPKGYVDGLVAGFLHIAGGDVITGGFTVTPWNQPAGSFTVNPLKHNYQWQNNSGAYTITAPITDGAVDLLVINAAGAGAITFSGFTVGPSIGDALTTTVGHRFLISIRRINGVATYLVKALQ
jgi:hypothetical protein